ncbi:hypothetical protein LU293_04135 [Moraxella nasovis]|uniref:hypothetical protein n=1 Tax=Moraxella nasovis TaxID=2904121 RepID=UPI001F6030A9|nr:hypothetical protein [Moraxella nasovis]UNU74091.1 hypothetical protein LU293_04135 [Moraxella nasovis]
MSQTTQAMKKVAIAVYNVKQKIGDTQNLSTNDKTLAGAINEVATKVHNITDGASSAFDTLKEIEDALQGSSATAEMLKQIGDIKNRLQALESHIDNDILQTIETALTTGA